MTTSGLPSFSLRASEARGDGADGFADSALFDGVLGRRVGGYLVDAALVLLINIVLHGLLLILGFLTFGLAWLLWGPVTLLTVALAYGTLFVGGGRGATPGMRLFGVEARNLHGAPPEYVQAFLMTALFYATVPTTSFLILVIAFFTERKRTAHDLLSGITVVRR